MKYLIFLLSLISVITFAQPQQPILYNSNPNRQTIVSIADPQSISVLNGTAFGSIPFQATVRAFYKDSHYDDVAVTYATGSYNSGTNGLYILTGTIQGTQITVSIDVWVLPAPTQWFDLIDGSLQTHGLDNIGRLVASGNAKVGSTYTKETTGVSDAVDMIYRPSWNMDGMYFNTQGALRWGTTSSHNTFHQDLSWTIYVVWYQITVGTTHFGPLFDSNDASSSNTGISLMVDNRIGSGNTNSLTFFVTKGVGGQTPININSTDNAVVQEAWNWVKIKFDGTTCTMYANGSSVGTATPAIAFSVGNATTMLHVGNKATIGANTGMNGYLKHIYMEDSFVSGATETTLDSWAAAMCAEGVVPENANFYLEWGQSNTAGRGATASINPELNLGSYKSKIMVLLPTPPTQTDGTGTIDSRSHWEILELNRNQTIENVATQHGMEMRFGKEMSDLGHDAWIVKMGVGGTPVISTVTYNDWNSSNTQLFPLYKALVGTALPEIKHIFRKTPVIRGMIIMQGETDAIIVGAGTPYKANMTAVINGFIDHIVASGYTVNKLRILIFRISDAGGYAGYDATAFPLIKTAQEDIGNNYLTDNSSYSGNVLGSTWRTTDDFPFNTPPPEQHYSVVGLDLMARYLFDYFKQYVKE